MFVTYSKQQNEELLRRDSLKEDDIVSAYKCPKCEFDFLDASVEQYCVNNVVYPIITSFYNYEGV